MTIEVFIFVLIIHYLADFALQTNWQAMNKWHSMRALLYHTLTYSLVWFFAMYVFMDWYKCLVFACITLLAHTITDYITSRIAKPFFHREDYHNGWAVVGIDQIFHYVQLIFTFKILSEWTY